MREGRRLPGTAGYLWAALRHLFRFEPSKVAATGDFGRLETEVLLVAAAVTRSYGGGMRIAPHADPADGRFDVVIIGPVARRTVVAMLPRLFRGSHVRHPAVRIERSSFLEIETPGGGRPLYADGEPLGETPVSLRIAPGSLRVIAPRPSGRSGCRRDRSAPPEIGDPKREAASLSLPASAIFAKLQNPHSSALHPPTRPIPPFEP